MLVIGNGESRKTIDIDRIKCSKIGCNAIYRDYYMDHLVCVDKRMVSEVLHSGTNIKGTYVYTRPDWYKNFKTLRVREVPELPYIGSDRWDEPFQWGSGPYAILLAAKQATDNFVNVLGFDLWSNTDTINNVYKSTTNYDDASKRPIDPRYWIHQISMVFKCFPKIKFVIHQDNNWNLPKAWNQPNVKVDTISNIYYNT